MTKKISFCRINSSNELSDKVRLVFEDEHLLVLSKKPLLHSVALASSEEASVADWIAKSYPQAKVASPNPGDEGLVNRLDFSTSGLLIAAKNRGIWNKLQKCQKEGLIQKEYLALCEGEIEGNNFEIDSDLAQSPDGKRMLLVVSGKKYKSKIFPAKTSGRVVKEFESAGKNMTLVRLRGASFRRHQLRVHMSSIGHPLVGDEKYGSKHFLQELLNRDGFFLHSFSLGFEHPANKEYLRFEEASEELLIENV